VPTQARPGIDAITRFEVLLLTDNEVILGDSDKHFHIKVSVCKLS